MQFSRLCIFIALKVIHIRSIFRGKYVFLVNGQPRNQQGLAMRMTSGKRCTNFSFRVMLYSFFSLTTRVLFRRQHPQVASIHGRGANDLEDP